ncbi:hypothetical protein [uncultured Methylobacterium sp.]|uniref:hypothetical protein n=1 Tax=uncultured Methylobacterium sp. TaxID=157278 RepID=UPI0035CC2A05
MADYYPILMRAMQALPNGGASISMRRAVYDRARSALLRQLRELEPPLPEADIRAEEEALDTSVEKIEAEFSRLSASRDRDTQRDVLKGKLAEVVSPEPALSVEGKLDAAANKIYDAPDGEGDLVTLPIRQNTLIKTIGAGLPRNAPRHLKSALDSYSDELIARGSQPILGILRDMADIVAADVGAPNAAREWLPEGLVTAFEIFMRNHASLIEHFPLDRDRETLYSESNVNEDLAEGKSLTDPFDMVARASRDAGRAGLATQDFVMVVDKMTEFARVVASLPARQDDPTADTKTNTMNPKKRAVLTGFGFFERTYNLLGSTATLSGPPAGNALLTAIQNAAAALSKFIGF